jgi:hypothetical protein
MSDLGFGFAVGFAFGLWTLAVLFVIGFAILIKRLKA